MAQAESSGDRGAGVYIGIITPSPGPLPRERGRGVPCSLLDIGEGWGGVRKYISSMTDKPIQQNEWKSSSKQWELLKPQARRMRKAATPAEEHLWQQLRGKKVAGVKFRRQHTIDRFIVDFCSNQQRLIIEVDGEIHIAQKEQDAVREEYLRLQGYQILRFSNEDVLSRTEWVLTVIEETIRALE